MGKLSGKQFDSIDENMDIEELFSDNGVLPLLEYYYSSIYVMQNFAKPENQDDFYHFMLDVKSNYVNMFNNTSGNYTTQLLYPFTNENLAGLFKKLDVKNKKMLTVGSSVDQALNGVLYGASKVDLIDANIFTPFMIELKTAGIKNLNRIEFKDFCTNMPSVFLKYYPKISHDLSGNYQRFFDEVAMEDIGGYLRFIMDYSSYRPEDVNSSKFYIDDKAYINLQNKLRDNNPKINFIYSKLDDFYKNTNDKYDVILLSNIIDYYRNKPNDYFAAVKKLYKKRLNENGVIQITSRDFACHGDYRQYKVIEDFADSIGANLYNIVNSGMLLPRRCEDYSYPSLMLKKPEKTTENCERC